jgi:hypothetical protein
MKDRGYREGGVESTVSDARCRKEVIRRDGF